jgi:hypothetical protein
MENTMKEAWENKPIPAGGQESMRQQQHLHSPASKHGEDRNRKGAMKSHCKTFAILSTRL